MIGSAEEKAKIKDSLVPFVVGCVVVFGAFGFWKVAVNVFSSVSSEQTTVSEKKTTAGEKVSNFLDNAVFSKIDNASETLKKLKASGSSKE